jgi:hypothetical protein
LRAAQANALDPAAASDGADIRQESPSRVAGHVIQAVASKFDALAPRHYGVSMFSSRLFRRILPCLPLLATVPAQGDGPQSVPTLAGQAPPAIVRSSPALPAGAELMVNRTAGLQIIDGELWGASDHYKVRFDKDGFEFTPTLGRSAPRNYPLQFRLESIRRGETPVPLRSCQPSHSGLRVEYDRGGAVERYDLRPDAMEQSFVFAERPAGTGDLIVRGRIQTDMRVTPEHGGLRLEEPGVGGFHIGRVTGIDAKGDRAAGEVRLVGDLVELSLPHTFVEQAALPLVLDPLIGIGFGMSLLPQFDDELPRAAFDATNDAYLVVWNTAVSATDRDIFGQLISRAGSMIGTRISIDVNPTLDTEVDVANVNGRNAFVVVFTRAGDIIGKAVSAANGSVMTGSFIASGASNQHSPSIGGDSVAPVLFPSGSAVCVWESDGDLAVQARQVTVNIDLSLSVGPVNTLAQGSSLRASRPRISKGGGSPRR